MRELLEKTLLVNELDIKKGLRTAAAAGLIGAGAAGLDYYKGATRKPPEKPAVIAPAEVSVTTEEEPKKEWQTIRMRVTAYCPCAKCTGTSSPGITASGHEIQEDDVFVAADKRYSYGTEMIIPGYNDGQPVEVLDRGGAIQGDRIDVFFPTHKEALEWGVKNLDVKVHSELEESLAESTIDFPREDLDTTVWEKSDGTYALREEVKSKITDLISKYPDKDLNEIAKEIHIVGSIGTNQYGDDADIDVHIIPKSIDGWSEDDVNTVVRWFNKNRNELGGYVNKHPIEVYIQLDPNQDLMSDSCYSILDNKWLVGPKIVPIDLDPYEDFSHIADEIRNVVEDADVLFGELKRDVIDFEVIKIAMERMSGEDKERLLQKLEDKLNELEDDIEALYKKRGEWVDARHKASKPETPEQALKDVELAKKWRDTNAIFKFVNRYHYLRAISNLQKLLADEKITPDEVDKIKSIMGV